VGGDYKEKEKVEHGVLVENVYILIDSVFVILLILFILDVAYAFYSLNM
jgi:hypothetical protein